MLPERTYVTFESDYPLDESVARLEAATRRRSFATIRPESAVGRVDAQRVFLVREIPYVRNSFKPVFKGAFEEAGGRVALRGSFGMHVAVKVFMSFWFGCLLVLALFLGWRATQEQSDAGKIALACVGMMFAGAGLVALARWFARNDVAWLSNVIQRALTREPR